MGTSWQHGRSTVERGECSEGREKALWKHCRRKRSGQRTSVRGAGRRPRAGEASRDESARTAHAGSTTEARWRCSQAGEEDSWQHEDESSDGMTASRRASNNTANPRPVAGRNKPAEPAFEESRGNPDGDEGRGRQRGNAMWTERVETAEVVRNHGSGAADARGSATGRTREGHENPRWRHPDRTRVIQLLSYADREVLSAHRKTSV